MEALLYSTGLQPLYGKGPHMLLWASTQAAHCKITSHVTA